MTEYRFIGLINAGRRSRKSSTRKRISSARSHFVSKLVKSLALRKLISSILANNKALPFRASIFEASGCCFSRRWIHSLNEASCRRSRSISASFFAGPAGVQPLCAPAMIYPHIGHAFVTRIRSKILNFPRRCCGRRLLDFRFSYPDSESRSALV
jgi:hypothetical protein